MTGIACPFCGWGEGQEVTDSRPAEGYIRRRRRCPCGERYSTAEVVFRDDAQMVVNRYQGTKVMLTVGSIENLEQRSRAAIAKVREAVDILRGDA